MGADIYAQIEAERAYQRERWGNTFDDTHTPADWWAFVMIYMAKALPGWKNPGTDVNLVTLRAGLIKVATIFVAWIEAIDRKLASS